MAGLRARGLAGCGRREEAEALALEELALANAVGARWVVERAQRLNAEL